MGFQVGRGFLRRAVRLDPDIVIHLSSFLCRLSQKTWAKRGTFNMP
jgi:hypothetical protein